MASEQTKWYIVKQEEGQCHIVPDSERPSKASGNPADAVVETSGAVEAGDAVGKWGPFDSESDAIARRVGLIRAGKCSPA